MNVKKVLPLVLCVFVIHTGFAQDENEDTKKQLAKAFKIFEAMNARYGSLSVPGEFIQQDNKIVGQYYTSSFYSTTYKPGNVHRALYFPDPNYPKVVMKDGNCNTQHVDLSQYETTTLAPNITRIVEKGYAISGSNKVRGFFVVEYGPDNRVKSVNGGNIVLDKKSGSPLFEYITSNASYTWKNDYEVSIATSTYYDKKKEKDQSVRISGHTYQHRLEKNNVESTIELGRVVQYVTIGNETTLKSKTKAGDFRLSNKFITDGEKVVTMESYNYNNETDVLESKGVTHYTLRKSSGYSESDTDVCTFTMVPFTSIYDAQGNLVEERKDGKFRKKNADGPWSEWTSFRM